MHWSNEKGLYRYPREIRGWMLSVFSCSSLGYISTSVGEPLPEDLFR